MSVLPLDPSSSEPPFEQLRRQVATRAASGDLAPGTRLPAEARRLGLGLDEATRLLADAWSR